MLAHSPGARSVPLKPCELIKRTVRGVGQHSLVRSCEGGMKRFDVLVMEDIVGNSQRVAGERAALGVKALRQQQRPFGEPDKRLSIAIPRDLRPGTERVSAANRAVTRAKRYRCLYSPGANCELMYRPFSVREKNGPALGDLMPRIIERGEGARRAARQRRLEQRSIQERAQRRCPRSNSRFRRVHRAHRTTLAAARLRHPHVPACPAQRR